MRLELSSFLQKNPITPKCLTFWFQAWLLEKSNAVFDTHLVTTVLNILFQGVCIPQDRFQLYVTGSNVVQVGEDQDEYVGEHVALSNTGQGGRENLLWTPRDSLCDLTSRTLTDPAPSPGIAAHRNTFAGSCAQAPKKDKDDFSVFWLAANDPQTCAGAR